MPSLRSFINPTPKVSKNTAKLMEYAPPLNPEDPEYLREVRRPAEIKEDVKLMENRKRVSLILNSESFRRDLEEVVKLQLRSGPFPDNWAALHSLSDMLVPHAQYGAAVSTFTKGSFMPAMPINDLRHSASKNGHGDVPAPPRYSKPERLLRCKLAAVFRLVDIFGWSAVMSSCITARLGREKEEYLMNPFGLLYHEITASSLVKIDSKGNVLDAGSTGLQVDASAWVVPAAIHAAREDIRCVIQLRNPVTVAVSAMKCGLLPLSQEAMLCGPVAQYDPFSDSEIERGVAQALGDNAKLLLVRSHGLYACGRSVEEAYHFAFNAIAACQSQLKLLPLGLDKLVMPGEAVRDAVYQVGSRGSGGVGMHGGDGGTAQPASHANEDGAGWNVGELEFEALMRQLDQAGYRTGYLYRPTGEVATRETAESGDELSLEGKDAILVPPAASSYMKTSEEKSATLPAGVGAGGGSVTHWSNTPNAYKREEIDEIGTSNPKKITRWVSPEEGDETQTSGLSQAIVSPNQFAPQGLDPKEYKERQKEIKEHYFNDVVDPGHQSKLLENITYEEARKLQEAREGKLAGDHVVVVGAVSRGIIHRDHRHNVAVYKSVYASNPFHQVTDTDIKDYQREVRRKNASPEELTKIDAEEKAEREAAAALSSDGEDVISSSAAPVTRSMPPASATDRLSAGTDRPDASTPSRDAAPVEESSVQPVTVAKQHAALAKLQRNESDSKRSSGRERAGPSGGQYATLATPGRTDTSDADVTTHTEVTDTEGGGKDGKEKKKKRRFKLPSFSRKSKEAKESKHPK